MNKWEAPHTHTDYVSLFLGQICYKLHKSKQTCISKVIMIIMNLNNLENALQ